MSGSLQKILRLCPMLLTILLLTACAGDTDNSITVGSDTNDTLVSGALTQVDTAASAAISASSDLSASSFGDSTVSSSESDTSSSTFAATEEEFNYPEYVFNALLKSSAFPTYKETDLKNQKTDVTASDIRQIDFELTPQVFTSLDSGSGFTNNGLVTANIKEITSLSADCPKAYLDVFNMLNEQAVQARERYEEILSSLQNSGKNAAYFRYGETLDLVPCRMDSRVLSIIQIKKITADGDGQKHAAGKPALSFRSINIDGQSGREMMLSDVVKNTDKLALLAAEMLYQTYVTSVPYQGAAALFTEKELQSSLTKMFSTGTNYLLNNQGADFAWSPSYLGLHLFFSAATLSDAQALEAYRGAVSGCKELDMFEIIIPYRYASSLFVSSYTALPESFIAKLQPGAAYAFDFAGTLIPFRISLPMESTQRGDGIQNASFTGMYNLQMKNLNMDIPVVNNNPSATTGASFYLVRHEGSCYLYVQQLTTEQNGAKLQIYKYKATDYEPDELSYFELVGVSDDCLDLGGTPPLNPACFRSRRRVNILPDPVYGRLSNLDRTVYVTDNGLPGSDDTFFDVEGDFTRTTAIDLNMDVLIDFEKEITENRLFPAGTQMVMFRAQLLPYTQADFITADGTVVRLHVNGVDAIDNVDGHMIEEAFGSTVPIR